MEPDNQASLRDSVAAPYKKIAYAVIGLLVGVLALLCIIWIYLSIQVDARKTSSRQIIVTIEKGERAERIAQKLESQNLISSARIFLFHLWRENKGSLLQAGNYALHDGMSVRDIASLITQGNVHRDDVSITIPEGFTLKEIEGRFSQIASLGFSQSIGQLKSAYRFLEDAPDDATLEGFLFPDTYRFERARISEEDVISKMLANFDKKMTHDMRDEIRAQGKRIFDIVIMASLIEKEVITEEDMRLVSGLLWKRLAIGMPLQVDATVVYAVGHRELTLADLQVDSPYNTYRYKGLPVGPISNPGLQALRAALYPTESEYLFYLSKPDKQTVFSKTLAEHNRAKALYLQ